MRLWIDDVRTPERFRPGETDWHHCRSNTEAIRVLDTMAKDITAIAIDHDICHEVPIDDSVLVQPFACPETFEATVRYLALWAVFFNKTNVPIEIITSNGDGAKRFQDILSERFIITVNPGGKKK